MKALKRSPDVNHREWIREMLYVWARHVRGPVVFIGWPPESILARMMREGAGAGESSARVKQPFPLDVQRVENAVVKLPQELREAIVVKYVLRGMSDQQRAKDMCMPCRRFRYLLGCAYREIKCEL